LWSGHQQEHQRPHGCRRLPHGTFQGMEDRQGGNKSRVAEGRQEHRPLHHSDGCFLRLFGQERTYRDRSGC
uniref:hypothetical protein n=1 Tax=Prevotella aurantiaca TaxID=596085 RepID=UPI001F38AC14